MLVCSVSQRARRAAIVADLAEVAAALDAPGTGNVVFATLVDDPASVGEIVDAFLGEIMQEAASAADSWSASIPLTGDIVETASAVDALSASAGIAATTFNPATATAVTLSGGNLIATHSTTANAGVSSSSFKSTGKYYFEITHQIVDVVSSGGVMGVLVSSGSVTDSPVTNANAVGPNYGSGNTIIYANATNTGKSLGAAATGNVFAAAIDLTARLAWFRRNNGTWNGDATADPATGAGGIAFPAGSYAPYVRFSSSGVGVGDAQTANFGATAFTGTVPSGFTPGWAV
jgi:hypothetical protein